MIWITLLLGEILGEIKLEDQWRSFENLHLMLALELLNQKIPIVGRDTKGYMLLGASPYYNECPVYLDVNNFFSNHFATFGNTGSGKSCGVSRIVQNMFHLMLDFKTVF